MSRYALRHPVRWATTAVALFGALALGVAAPAQAETRVIPDGRDTDAAQELIGVRVVHGGLVRVVMRFSSNYHREGEYPFAIYYDTRRRDRGPEFIFVSHFGGVFRTETWGDIGDHAIDCRVEGDDNLRRHTLTIAVGHRCLGGDDGPVRINVSAQGQADDLGFVPDYAPGFHQFSLPVARG
jgi:hypothetical protein